MASLLLVRVSILDNFSDNFDVWLGIPMSEEGEEKPKLFTPSKGLTSAEAARLLEQWGRNELAEKNKSKVCQTVEVCVKVIILSLLAAYLLGVVVAAHAYHDLDCCLD